MGLPYTQTLTIQAQALLAQTQAYQDAQEGRGTDHIAQ